MDRCSSDESSWNGVQAAPGSEVSRRLFLRDAGLATAASVIPQLRPMPGRDLLSYERGSGDGNKSGPKVIVVIIGGVRRAETFSREGLENIPHLSGDMLPQALFYAHVRNEGVTAHFNAISSILTGTWQRVDDWGKMPPAAPTMFEQYRKSRRADRRDTWIVASNKALTSVIGASSDTNFGTRYGANAVFPKQLMLLAIADALRAGRTANMADRQRVQQELEIALAGSNYEGLGWNVSEAADRLDPDVRGAVQSAIAKFVQDGGATSGDELTFLMTLEIMRKFSPSMMVVALSDVEAAHFGSYALHVGGIRTADRLAWQLWQEVQANLAYRNKTTMIILPEFGRDPDGSSTNGFFNHRANEDSTRDTWMIALGAGVDGPAVVERPVHHVDVCPTVAGLMGYKPVEMQGIRLEEFRESGRAR